MQWNICCEQSAVNNLLWQISCEQSAVTNLLCQICCEKISCETSAVKNPRGCTTNRTFLFRVRGSSHVLSRKLFGWSSEYTDEGQHARVKRRVGNIVNRSEAYNSLVLRLPYFVNLFKRFPHYRNFVAECLQRARNPLTLLLRLGFEHHPCVIAGRREKLHKWSRHWRQVLYHPDL